MAARTSEIRKIKTQFRLYRALASKLRVYQSLIGTTQVAHAARVWADIEALMNQIDVMEGRR